METTMVKQAGDAGLRERTRKLQGVTAVDVVGQERQRESVGKARADDSGRIGCWLRKAAGISDST
jgi:hypothetical protein